MRFFRYLFGNIVTQLYDLFNEVPFLISIIRLHLQQNIVKFVNRHFFVATLCIGQNGMPVECRLLL